MGETMILATIIYRSRVAVNNFVARFLVGLLKLLNRLLVFTERNIREKYVSRRRPG